MPSASDANTNAASTGTKERIRPDQISFLINVAERKKHHLVYCVYPKHDHFYHELDDAPNKLLMAEISTSFEALT